MELFNAALYWYWAALVIFQPSYCCNPTITETPLRNGNAKPRNPLERSTALWLQCSAVHITSPDETENMNIWAHRGLLLRPCPLKLGKAISVCQCSRRAGRRKGYGGVGWGGLYFYDGANLWSMQLISNGLASLGLLSSLIPRPRLWPRCDYPLGKRTTQDRRQR